MAKDPAKDHASDQTGGDKRMDQANDQGKSQLTKNMEKALAMKQDSAGSQIPDDRTSHDGMPSLPNESIAPSGAFGAEGNTPVLSRSRGVRKGDRG
ncbi:MAG: hypothetical protein MEP57_04830 [Microvirga sp.]|nr:hypothetical protein [Microvirga sp.]